MAPGLELNGKLDEMENSAYTEDGHVAREPVEKSIGCAFNYEDNILEMEHSGDNPLVETESDDTTEYSSSFGNTASSAETDGTLSDPEVISRLRGDGNGEKSLRREKRVTSHWKKFSHPLAWRFRWLELKIKMLESQALKYDLQLAEIKQRKQLKSDDLKVEKGMKRKKRSQVEDTIDKEAYMARHKLFSYSDNRRTHASVIYFDDDEDFRNPGISMDKEVDDKTEFDVSLEFKDGDNSSEKILLNIGVLESRAAKLKTKLNKVMDENAEKISLGERFSFLIQQCNASTESTVSSRGEVANLSNLIESTDQPQVGTSSKNAQPGDRPLISNHTAEEELKNVDDFKTQPIEKPKVPKEEQESTIPSAPMPADLSDDKPNLNILSESSNTRGRGSGRGRGRRRRRRAGRWSSRP